METAKLHSRSEASKSENKPASYLSGKTIAHVIAMLDQFNFPLLLDSLNSLIEFDILPVIYVLSLKCFGR